MRVEGLTDAFKAAFPDSLTDMASDVIKGALYTPDADLGPATAAYTDVDEITGSGYEAGGVVVTLLDGYPQTINGVSVVGFENIEIAPMVVNVPIGGILLYNETSGLAIAVYGCGPVFVPRGGRLRINWNAPQSGVAPIMVA